MLNNINYNPDVLTCLANLSNDEVFTPPDIVNQMLDLLPSDLWQNKEAKFLDPVTKSGVFLREIAKRLNSGLAEQIPDSQTRLNHIFKHQLYGISITELTGFLARRSVYCCKKANSPLSICTDFDNEQGNIVFKRIEHTWQGGKCTYCGASQATYDRDDALETHAYQFIHTDNLFDIFGVDMKFDVIIGNPPYQLSSGGFGAQALPIYQYFVEQAKKLNPNYICFIIPARWYAGGMGLDDFRKTMLNDKHICVLIDYPDSTECFPGVDISGGICYFLWSVNHNQSEKCKFISIQKGIVSESYRLLNTNGVLVRHNSAINIIEKIQSKCNVFLSCKVSSINPFNLKTNFDEYEKDLSSKNIIVYGRNKSVSYLAKAKLLKGHCYLDKFKVLVGQAYGERGAYPYLITGKPFLAEPNTCCTATYLVVDTAETKEIAENIKTYLETKFCRFLISLRKNTQHLHADKFNFVPLENWSEPWTDEKLYKKYGLTQEEIAFIESMIRPMELES